MADFPSQRDTFASTRESEFFDARDVHSSSDASTPKPKPPLPRNASKRGSTTDIFGISTLDDFFKKPAEADMAFKYFTHLTLPRYRKNEEGKWCKVEKGDIGDSHAYPVYSTPIWALIEFGFGVGLYYFFLAVMSATCFIMFFVLLKNALYFGGSEYSRSQSTLKWSLRGTAACDDTVQVYLNNTGTLATMNNCMIEEWMGWTCLSCSFLLLILCLSAKVLINKVVVAQDESEQTAQDYSVVISDPSPEATDPDEWRDFFEQQCGLGTVVSVSVALNNAPLMKALEQKHYILKQIKLSNKFDESWRAKQGPLDTHPRYGLLWGKITACLQSCGIGCDARYWWEQLHVVERSIASLTPGPNPDDAAQQYEAVRVFVIFDAESSQRDCLKAMSLGRIPAALDWGGSVEARYQWRNKDGTTNVLDVTEAPEPTEVRWDMFHTTYIDRLISQGIATTICLGLVATGFFLLMAFKGEPARTSLIIVSLNALFPTLFKEVAKVEKHLTTVSQQRSLLLKLLAARILTTGIAIFVLADRDEILTPAFVTQVQDILIADALTAPIVRVLDPVSRIMQYVSASPQISQSQAQMNTYFEGTEFWLAERYTDMLKTLFVSLIYLAINPTGILITAIALCVSYWADKYCLLRRWKTPPTINQKIANYANSFFLFIILVHVMFSAVLFSGWPSDSVCGVNVTTPEMIAACGADANWPVNSMCTVRDDARYDAATTMWVAYTIGNATVSTTPGIAFIKCGKSLSRVGPEQFFSPEMSRPYLPAAQATVVKTYRAVIIALLICFGVVTCMKLYDWVYKLFYSSYSTDTRAMDISYSSIVEEDESMEIEAYIPHLIDEAKHTHPLLMSELSLLDEERELVSFTADNYDDWCCYHETFVPEILKHKNCGTQHPAFSVCKYYGATRKGPKGGAWRKHTIDMAGPPLTASSVTAQP